MGSTGKQQVPTTAAPFINNLCTTAAINFHVVSNACIAHAAGHGESPILTHTSAIPQGNCYGANRGATGPTHHHPIHQ